MVFSPQDRAAERLTGQARGAISTNSTVFLEKKQGSNKVFTAFLLGMAPCVLSVPLLFGLRAAGDRSLFLATEKAAGKLQADRFSSPRYHHRTM